MVKSYVTVDVNKVVKKLTKFTRKLPIVGRRGVYLFTNRLAVAIRDEARLRGHNVSGYLSSEKGTHTVKLDKNSWGIKMPGYTKYLENGTTAHFIPRTWKTQLAAKKYGMSFSMLRAIISGDGTKPHPFVSGVIIREVNNVKEPREQIHRLLKT